MKRTEKGNLEKQKANQWLPGLEWERGLTASGHEESLWGDASILKLDCGNGCTTL